VARVLRMPAATDGDEAVLSSWLVDEADDFAAAQTIAYVETATLMLSVEAGRPGVLLKTLVEPGTHVDVGMPIGVIADPDEPVRDLDALLVELGVNRYAVAAAPVPAARVAERPEPAPVAPVASSAERSTAASEPRAPMGPVPASAGKRAKLTHDHLRATIRAERLAALAAVAGTAGLPVTVEHLVVRAVAAALRVVPEMNLTRDRDGVRRPDTVDLAIAIGTPDGFAVPVLRDVSALSLRDIAQLVAELTDEAGTGRLHTADRGGSIAISHLGRYGVDESVPGVTAPQVASLAVGGIRDEPVVEGGGIVAGKALTLTLSVDHDAVDDVLATRWLGALAALLERPEWMHD
jgi:pyruvate dehydrogenase E2 component (dihydrolipoyllysine-residue acetyltransferase)